MCGFGTGEWVGERVSKCVNRTTRDSGYYLAAEGTAFLFQFELGCVA